MVFVDGEWVSREHASPDDVKRALDAAARVQPVLARTPAHQRASWCEAIAHGIAAKRTALAQSIVAEAKKPIRYAEVEVDRAVQTFLAAAACARTLHGEVVPIDAAPGGEGRLGMAVRVPRGPCLAITPFNFPLNLSAHKIAPAIACGAAVIHKPSSDVPGAALLLAEIAAAAGLPPGALQTLPLAKNEDADPLLADDRIRVVSFTGSAAVGWKLRERSPKKQVVLELGGNAAALLLEDADLERALPTLVTSAFAYAGQVCIKLQRILVHHRLWHDFPARFVAATQRLAVVGDPASPETVVGPVIRTRDVDRIQGWVDEAIAGGAERLLGGRREGDTLWPTVLTHVPRDARVWREEIFGPVCVLAPFDDLDDAITQANDSPYGLQAAVYTNDHAALARCHRELEVGAVIHDDSPSFRADLMPYGGTKGSGTGREGPRYAIEELTEWRMLVTREATPRG
jgi:acyl-CoA reductase-like NAD-dependent aldehyde dehydrogenase